MKKIIAYCLVVTRFFTKLIHQAAAELHIVKKKSAITLWATYLVHASSAFLYDGDKLAFLNGAAKLITTEVSSSVYKSKTFVSCYRLNREHLKIWNLLFTLATILQILHMVTKAVRAMCKYYGRSFGCYLNPHLQFLFYTFIVRHLCGAVTLSCWVLILYKQICGNFSWLKFNIPSLPSFISKSPIFSWCYVFALKLNEQPCV
jgi:hypothetical protein